LNIKRYEIYFADLKPTIGSEIEKTRPVVIISQDEMNKYLDTVVVSPLTSKIASTLENSDTDKMREQKC